MDGLKAVNVYAIETEHGLTLIDGGWAIEVAAACWRSRLRDVGYGFARHHPVPGHPRAPRPLHAWPPSSASEFGADVSLGLGRRAGPRPAPRPRGPRRGPVARGPAIGRRADDRRRSGAASPTASCPTWRCGAIRTPGWTATTRSRSGTRTIDAVHTPGHTQGHYVFADRPAGLLFAGDHVLPTITPSIGFEPVPAEQPLRDFMASLTKVRGLPDLRLLPAHGPVAPSSHARVDELLASPRGLGSGCASTRSPSGPGTGIRRRPRAALDPARACPRRPRRVQRRHGQHGDQGPPRAAGGAGLARAR